MAYTVEMLAEALQGPGYTPMSEEEMLRQAQARYQNAYDQKALGARQAHEVGELAYGQQMAQVAASYDGQAARMGAQTARAVSDADRRALGRGMQRSSYNLATLANAQRAGDEAMDTLGAARAQAEGNISAERTLRAAQLAQALAAARQEYDTNVGAYTDTLRAQDYARQTEAARYQNELTMALYEYARQQAQQQNQQAQWQEQQQTQQAQWLAEFTEGVREFDATLSAKLAGSKTSGGSGKTTTTKAKTTTVTALPGAATGAAASTAAAVSAAAKLASIGATVGVAAKKVAGK
ncbi:hypothetical protein FACS1894196_4240 [Clostridia bacterium]|nr:hypothetical protein FACS1894196_4240 [Clostridia bacterium]